MRTLIAIAIVLALHAQTPGSAMRFETASIRPWGGPREQDAANPSFQAYRAGKASSFCLECVSGTHYDNYGMDLKVLIAKALRIDSRLIAGPAWLDDLSSRFAIHASMPEGAVREQIPEMMKALLQERFHLATHTATVEQVGYALVVAKNGPKLKAAREIDRSECSQWVESIPVDGKTSLTCRIPSKDGGPVGGTVLMTNSHFGPMRNSSTRTDAGVERRSEYFRIRLGLLVEDLGELLSTGAPFAGIPGKVVQVVDKTGIEGEWDVVIDHQSGDLALPSVNGSLERQGLRLEKMMVPVETLLIDRVDRMPTEN